MIFFFDSRRLTAIVSSAIGKAQAKTKVKKVGLLIQEVMYVKQPEEVNFITHFTQYQR